MAENNDPKVEVEDNGLSYNPELENTKVIASDGDKPIESTEPIPSTDGVKPDAEPEDNGLRYNEDLLGAGFIRDKRYNIDVNEYLGDVGNGT